MNLRCVISSFIVALDSFHSTLFALEFDTFCYDYGIGSEFGSKLPGPNDTIRDFPEGNIGVYTRRYSEEFLILTGLSRMWYAPMARPVFYDDDEEDMRLYDFNKVPNPFDVVCAEKKLSEDEKPILKQTTDVVTPLYDQIVSLGPISIDQVFSAATLPPHSNDRKGASEHAPAGEFASKKGKSVGWGFSTGACAARESVSKVDDALSIWLFGDLPRKKSLAPRKPLSKKGQLVTGPPKSAMRESVVGSSHEAADDLCSSKAGSKQLVSRRSFKTSTSLFFASTLEDSTETPREDPFYASVSVDPSVAKDIYHPY
nr:hypothetical protein [Tanacetum cinerariifolium]